MSDHSPDHGPAPLTASLDCPQSGAQVCAPLLTIAGWSLHDPIARIDVTINGETIPARQMTIPRPDVAQAFGSVHADLWASN